MSIPPNGQLNVLIQGINGNGEVTEETKIQIPCDEPQDVHKEFEHVVKVVEGVKEEYTSET